MKWLEEELAEARFGKFILGKKKKKPRGEIIIGLC